MTDSRENKLLGLAVSALLAWGGWITLAIIEHRSDPNIHHGAAARWGDRVDRLERELDELKEDFEDAEKAAE